MAKLPDVSFWNGFGVFDTYSGYAREPLPVRGPQSRLSRRTEHVQRSRGGHSDAFASGF